MVAYIAVLVMHGHTNIKLIPVLLDIIGAVSFVLYRRRFLNKPQTLNDKCSNPDSSGYIDDSTLRVSVHNEKVPAVRT